MYVGLALWGVCASLLFLVILHANSFSINALHILNSFALPPVQALHEALLRQEELLAYIDSQEEAKFQVSWVVLHLGVNF